MSAASDHHGEPGSLADEALRLVEALSTWSHEHVPADDAEGAAGDTAAAPSSECAWCPVCRALRAVRVTDPEVRRHLAAAGTSLVAALSAALAPPADRTDTPDNEPPGQSGQRPDARTTDEGDHR